MATASVMHSVVYGSACSDVRCAGKEAMRSIANLDDACLLTQGPCGVHLRNRTSAAHQCSQAIRAIEFKLS